MNIGVCIYKYLLILSVIGEEGFSIDELFSGFWVRDF